MFDSSTMAFAFLVIVIVGLALIIGPYWRQKRREREERSRQLQAIAGQRGWTFVRAATLDTIPGCESFGLFSKGHSKTIENMMTGEANGIKMAVFDYLYVSDHGEEDHHSYAQTVLHLKPGTMSIPYFSLQPENVLHKLFSNFGYQDFDFGQRPVFSSQYLLRGEDERAIRNTFNDGLLSLYEAHPGTCTEGRGNQLFIYRDDQRLEPSEIQSFIALGLNILNLLPRQV